MSDVLRDEDLQGRLVVSIDGEDVAHVRGVVEDDDDQVVALTLAGTGLFASDLDEVLPRSAVRGVGPDAVVVASPDVFLAPEDLNGHDAGAEVRTADGPATADGERPDGSMLFTEARTRDVVTADGECVGRVDRFVVDPDNARVGSLRLDNVADMRRYLSWRDIDTFGPDRVTVPDVRALRLGDGPREERIRRDYGMLGKRIVTDAGHELGKVVDVAFDPDDGAVTCLVLEDQELAGDRLLGVGPYAVVVTH